MPVKIKDIAFVYFIFFLRCDRQVLLHIAAYITSAGHVYSSTEMCPNTLRTSSPSTIIKLILDVLTLKTFFRFLCSIMTFTGERPVMINVLHAITQPCGMKLQSYIRTVSSLYSLFTR